MKTISKGMCWVIWERSIEKLITRCFDQGEDADSQNENNVSQNCLVHRRDSYARQSVPETIRETAVPRTAECEKGAADRAVQNYVGWLSTDSRYSKAAETLCVPKRNFGTEKEFRNRWTENFPDENVCHRRQGYLPKLVTKMNEMPTTFESSVVK